MLSGLQKNGRYMIRDTLHTLCFDGSDSADNEFEACDSSVI